MLWLISDCLSCSKEFSSQANLSKKIPNYCYNFPILPSKAEISLETPLDYVVTTIDVKLLCFFYKI